MARMDEAPTPDILYTETANASITTPASGNQKLFVDTDHLLKLKNSSGTVTGIGGMTNPLTTTGDIIYSSSGTTAARRAIGSTGDVLTVAGGVPTWAAPSAGFTFAGARAIRTTTQSISNTTVTPASLDSETAPGWDVGSVHEGVTNPSRFTVPTGGAGKWTGMGGGGWDANGSVGRYMWWRINGTTDVPGSAILIPAAFGATEGGYNQQCVCPAVLLADADYLELILYQDSGGTRTIGAASLGVGSLAASVWRVG